MFFSKFVAKPSDAFVCEVPATEIPPFIPMLGRRSILFEAMRNRYPKTTGLAYQLPGKELVVFFLNEVNFEPAVVFERLDLLVVLRQSGAVDIRAIGTINQTPLP